MGVVSGAGDFRPALILGDLPKNKNSGVAIALVGRVYCLVDATYGPVNAGDMLTTSRTSGHAMKASDREKAFGTVIGKSMGRLHEGRGLVLTLVSLR